MKVFTRAEWGARPPRGAYGTRPSNRRAIIHWSGSKITPAGVTAGAHERKAPARPGRKWYKLWRDKTTPVAQRRKLSKMITAYNRQLKLFKAYEAAQAAVDPKIVELEKSILRQFQNYHMDGHGWLDIGYHEVIFASGNVYLCRPTTAWGAHCMNANERLGFCLVMTEGDVPTPTMLETVEERMEYHGVTDAYGHKQIPGNSTACPGRLVRDLGLPRRFD